MLCETCQRIFSGKREKSPNSLDGEPVWYIHHASESLIYAPEHRSCHLCTVLWEKLQHRDEESKNSMYAGQMFSGYKGEPQIEYSIGSFEATSGFELTFRLAGSTNLPGEPSELQRRSRPSRYRSFYVAPAEAMEKYLSSSNEVSVSTRSAPSWNLAQGWIDGCLKQHDLCHQGADIETWYPTRLLDVGDDLSGDADTWNIRLHITAESPTDGRYMTLSHCWGGVVPLMLTDKTFEVRKAGIPFRSLPKTFADAVFITKLCGVKYLWIDSLCIIQGSQEDWQKEAMTMGRVYKNSLCNIAATGSDRSSGGCFSPRDPALVRPIRVEATWDEEDSNPPPGSYVCVDSDLWSRGVDNAPLGTRAWVVQERSLAPRQLHFGREQIYWECREHTACETFPGGLPTQLPCFGKPSVAFKELNTTLDRIKRWKMGIKDDYLPDDLDEMIYGAYWGWRDLVPNYSRCALTFGSDKMIAISGLAKEMQQAVNDEYLAGLWRKYLPSQLLWHTITLVKKDSELAIRPRPLRAPTWSWASTEADVDCHDVPPREVSDEVMVEILNVQVTTVTDNSTGQVTGGLLRMCGQLYRATVHENRKNRAYWMTLKIGQTWIGGEVNVDEAPMLVGTAEHGIGTDIHCMPVLCSRKEDGTGFEWLEGLLLQPTGEEKGQFERFGAFDTSDAEGLQVFEQPFEHVDRLEYEEIDGKDGYIITISKGCKEERDEQYMKRLEKAAVGGLDSGSKVQKVVAFSDVELKPTLDTEFEDMGVNLGIEFDFKIEENSDLSIGALLENLTNATDTGGGYKG